MSCGVGCRRGLDPELLWLWRRPVATALIRPLAWEPPYAAVVALKKQKINKKGRRGVVFCFGGGGLFACLFLFLFFCFLGLHLRHVEVPRLGVKLELQLLTCATATATRSELCLQFTAMLDP